MLRSSASRINRLWLPSTRSSSASILDQAPGRSEQIMEILNHSRTVNDALEEVVGARILRIGGLARAQTFTADLVELLDRTEERRRTVTEAL